MSFFIFYFYEKDTTVSLDDNSAIKVSASFRGSLIVCFSLFGALHPDQWLIEQSLQVSL
jgi:hypothetical protein